MPRDGEPFPGIVLRIPQILSLSCTPACTAVRQTGYTVRKNNPGTLSKSRRSLFQEVFCPSLTFHSPCEGKKERGLHDNDTWANGQYAGPSFNVTISDPDLKRLYAGIRYVFHSAYTGEAPILQDHMKGVTLEGAHPISFPSVRPQSVSSYHNPLSIWHFTCMRIPGKDHCGSLHWRV
jgi:hypothetical protein